ncbi:MAG: hypothetical protein E7564_05900 [Ruminococcaceae bacterium]|nr:hypothetical protein [Oscillospiraceae bacterium]
MKFEDVIYNYDFNHYRIPHPYIDTDYYIISPSYSQEFLLKARTKAWEFFWEDQYMSATGGCSAELINFEIIERNVGVWTFKRNKVVFGNIPDETFKVISNLTDTKYNVHLYEIGKEYFITTTHNWSDHWNCEAYRFVGGMHINLTDLFDFSWYRGTIIFPDYATKESILNHFKCLAEDYGYNNAP